VSEPRTIELDVLIIGGGIAGLWTLATLLNRGLRAGLIEAHALGQGQTLWSQGIIHGGIKYALTGQASSASKAISAMPAAWRAALKGEGEVAIPAARVLSEHQLLWTTSGLLSRFSGVAASKAIRTPVQRLEKSSRPDLFASAPSSVDVYEVAEPVLDVPSVVTALSAGKEHAIARVSRVTSITHTAPHASHRVRVSAELHTGQSVTLSTRVLICCAGAGNAELARVMQGEHERTPEPLGSFVRMQTRPLHMLYAELPEPLASTLPSRGMLFGHCLGVGSVPRLTITSFSRGAAGPTHWLIGGGIAEQGVPRSTAEQIDACTKELRACLPWLDRELSGIRLSAGRIDRAEGFMPDGSRPDEPVIQRAGNILAVWPTKLAFAPLLALRIVDQLRQLGFTVNEPSSAHLAFTHDALASLPRAHVGTLPWETARDTTAVGGIGGSA
jgi:glycine/D-amino acid oxidase-like deaminating enzyme